MQEASVLALNRPQMLVVCSPVCLCVRIGEVILAVANNFCMNTTLGERCALRAKFQK